MTKIHNSRGPDTEAAGPPALLIEREVLSFLGISRTTLWRLRAAGLPFISIGRQVRYDLGEVREWLKDGSHVQTDLWDSAEVTEQRSLNHERADTVVHAADVQPCHWSLSVAMDPKHRPQSPKRPASTVRREWWRFPQEAHLLDLHGWRYRRLLAKEIAVLQGFPQSWGSSADLGELDQIRGFGDAVPPALAQCVFETVQEFLEQPIRTSLELCAGFGGMALGKERSLPLAQQILLEWWKPASNVLRTHDRWRGDVIEGDVRGFTFNAFDGKLDLMSGGPPCQPWSGGGKGLGVEDERDILGLTPEFVAAACPKAFVFENVPGLLQGENSDYARSLIGRLRNPGNGHSYGVAAGGFNAADFGVPQLRRRIFIIGLKDQSVSVVHDLFDRISSRRTYSDPTRVIPQGKRPWRTFEDALPSWGDVAAGWRRWIESDRPITAAINFKENDITLDK